MTSMYKQPVPRRSFSFTRGYHRKQFITSVAVLLFLLLQASLLLMSCQSTPTPNIDRDPQNTPGLQVTAHQATPTSSAAQTTPTGLPPHAETPSPTSIPVSEPTLSPITPSKPEQTPSPTSKPEPKQTPSPTVTPIPESTPTIKPVLPTPTPTIDCVLFPPPGKEVIRLVNCP